MKFSNKSSKTKKQQLPASSLALYNALSVGASAPLQVTPSTSSQSNSQSGQSSSRNSSGAPCDLARLLSKDHQARPANYTPIIPSKTAKQRREQRATMQQIQELERMAQQLERTAKEAKLEAKRKKQQSKHSTVMVWVNGVPRRIQCREGDMIYDDISSITGSVRST